MLNGDEIGLDHWNGRRRQLTGITQASSTGLTGELVNLLEHLHDARVIDSRSEDDEKIVEQHGLLLKVVCEGLENGTSAWRLL